MPLNLEETKKEPKKEDGREEEVMLRSEIKDNFTLKDMLGSVEKEMENRRDKPAYCRHYF